MRRAHAGAILAAVLAMAAAERPSAAPVPPGRSISLPHQEVRDTFFAYAVGILAAGVDVEADQAFLKDILSEFRANICLPFEQLAAFGYRRSPVDDAHVLELDFQGALRVPIPFSLLGYHPGSIAASSEVLLVGERRAELRLPTGALLQPVYSFAVHRGSLAIDLDPWLDWLLGDLVDDITISHLVVFRWRGTWRCLMLGSGRKGQPIDGMLNFRTNGIEFPLPHEIAGIGDAFRVPEGIAEAMASRSPAARGGGP